LLAQLGVGGLAWLFSSNTDCITDILAGAPTVNRKFGTKVAVLVGDFLFAQSSWFLAKLDNLEVGTEFPQHCLNAMKAATVQHRPIPGKRNAHVNAA